MKLDDLIKTAIKEESKIWLKKLEELGTTQYADNSDEKRYELGQFYTPPDLVIQMLETFDYKAQAEEKKKNENYKDWTIEGLELLIFSQESILDPTCGSGNLLMGALITGLVYNQSYPSYVFGNEFDFKTLALARRRLTDFCRNYYTKMAYHVKDDPEKFVEVCKQLAEYGSEGFWRVQLHQGNALNSECLDINSFDSSYVDKAYDEKEGVQFTNEAIKEIVEKHLKENNEKWVKEKEKAELEAEKKRKKEEAFSLNLKEEISEKEYSKLPEKFKDRYKKVEKKSGLLNKQIVYVFK